MKDGAQFRSLVGTTAPWETMEVDGIHLTYNDEGEGLDQNLTVVCLHAIGHGSGDFNHLQSALGRAYRVIRLDFPNHGNSENDSHPVSIQRYTELLTIFLNKLKLKSVVLIGNSLGGAVALQYTFLYPNRVRALILENPGGLDPMDQIKMIFTRLMAGLFSQGLKKTWWYKKGLTDYYRYLILPNQKAKEQREKIIASAWEIALPLTQAWQSFGNEDSDLRSIAASITCPVLFAWASQDKIVQLRRCLPTIQQFPSSTLQLFQAGHCPHLETSEEFEAAVKTFLEALDHHAATTAHC